MTTILHILLLKCTTEAYVTVTHCRLTVYVKIILTRSMIHSASHSDVFNKSETHKQLYGCQPAL